MKTKIRKSIAGKSKNISRLNGRHADRNKISKPVFSGHSLLNIKSILVPIDFSPSSEKALAYAVAFARQFGAKLTVLNVVEPVVMPGFLKSYSLSMETDKVMDQARSHLERVIKNLEIDPKLVEKLLVNPGRSFKSIVDAARMSKVDLIIISTHGYTGLKHALLGSTTERVVQHASCPVLVVRETEHDFM